MYIYILFFCNSRKMCMSSYRCMHKSPKYKMTSYVFNKIAANNSELCLIAHVLTTIYFNNLNFNVCFEGELHVQTRKHDVFINVNAQQRFSHLPVISSSNTYIQVMAMMVEVIHASVALTAMLCFVTRTKRENIKNQ